MTLRWRGGRAMLLVPVLTSALLQPGCAASVTGPEKGKRSVVTERQWDLDPLTFLAVDVDLTGVGNGNLDATVEWTFASDNVDLYATAQLCTVEMFQNQRCAVKAKADSPTARPERLLFGVAAGDRYRFWILNLGPQKESGTFAVGLTPE